ncbi:MFS transporter [Endozoicomonas sp. 8E]|uniref:MFS transporter n=1 Tax=Endozoicomonas sp. 8E TaxID=3035692 RepID=UPI0029392E20|nr:MFS transporter [Endozoicomonas sp. 8E]WOG28195.1 MFS transporter [Endozoicomonas sp. 8E]
MVRFVAPLSGMFIFALASGYLTTLIPLRINATDGNDFLAGLMGTAYYLGLLAGSFRSESIVCRVGHIRSFACFMALLCATVLSLALSENTISWLVLRFLNGMAVAGIFVVVESWLLCESESSNRGKVLSFYMVSLYGANAIGQLFVGFLDSSSLTPFILIGILLSLSIFPPAMTRIPTPEIEVASSLGFRKLFELTPSGVLGCFAGGLVLGGLYSMLPIYLADASNSDNHTVAIFLAITMTGGMALQFPVGYLSDIIDRRKMLILVTLAGCVVCLFLILSSRESWLYYPLLFLFGGAAFTLYPMAISHGCDHMHPDDIVAGTQGLLLAYSFGACIGPILASLFMGHISEGLMLYFITVMGATSIFFYIRMAYRPAIYTREEQNFIPVPGTTPIVTQIDPRSDAEELLETEDTAKPAS